LIVAAVCVARQAATTAQNAKPNFTDVELSRIFEQSPLGRPPQDGSRTGDDARAARLGQFLFFDSRISGSGKFSCATCHDPARAFTDGKPVAEAAGKTTRNSLSLMNAAYNRWFFWDGRADSLWSQALKPVEHPAELAGSRLQIAHLIDDDAQLRSSYESIFGKVPDLRDASRFPKRGGPSDCIGENEFSRAWQKMQPQDQEAVNRIFSNIGKSIASYERQLVSRRAPFDVFVEGLRENDAQKQQALSESAQRGLKLFVGRGECRLCHSGAQLH
jgi:cytochrome c peroxidase